MSQEEVDLEARRREVLALYELPDDSKASDVIQHVINVSGHMCTLFDLMTLAELFDGNVQLYITDNEKASVGDPRPL